MAHDDAQLEEFHDRAKDLIQKSGWGERTRKFLARENVPAYFREMGVVVISAWPDTVYFRLQGCMDHHLDVKVSTDPEIERLTIRGGEHTDLAEIEIWKR